MICSPSERYYRAPLFVDLTPGAFLLIIHSLLHSPILFPQQSVYPMLKLVNTFPRSSNLNYTFDGHSSLSISRSTVSHPSAGAWSFPSMEQIASPVPRCLGPSRLSVIQDTTGRPMFSLNQLPHLSFFLSPTPLFIFQAALFFLAFCFGFLNLRLIYSHL